MRRLALWVSLAGAAVALAPASSAAATWHPAPKGGLDCNGWSPVQKTFRQMWCTEIAANSNRGFIDNGWYVGHDEPDIGFFSFRHGSSNDMTYKTILPVDPSAPATQDGSVSHDFQLTPARW